VKRYDRKLWRGIAGIIAVVLILCILLITNAFVGNPISVKLAEKAIDEYIEENYPSLDLEIGKPVYNFKDGSYVVRVRSNTSIDTNFHVNYRGGEICYDSYESDVLGLFNTLSRLSKEYSNLVTDIVANELGYKENSTWVNYDENIYENPSQVLELDMRFDRELPISAEIMIDIDIESPSLDEASIILAKAHKVFKEKRCNFEKYGLSLKDEKAIINIMGVKPRDIESGKLLDLLKEAMGREDNTLIEGERGRGDELEGIFVDIIEKT